MAWFDSMHVSLSSLEASRARMEAASSNLANADSSAPENGAIYKVRRVRLEENATDSDDGNKLSGVSKQVQEMNLPPRMVFDPTHPDADSQGMVRYPDVDVITEMSELIHARHSYDAGLAAYNESRNMFSKSLEIGKG